MNTVSNVIVTELNKSVATVASGLIVFDDGKIVSFDYYDAGDETLTQWDFGVVSVTCVNGEFFDAPDELVQFCSRIERALLSI